ncbi:hypothetical protein M569_00014 [Genlisea aurea]|uniref:CCHC-type domain-containing protein n=1 Tax=Genlisea aurea TaxID=192259 RepID=S8D4P9_9LAMI|nr:hypothetical protein M569_00014 [Genlisea aurea]
MTEEQAGNLEDVVTGTTHLNDLVVNSTLACNLFSLRFRLLPGTRALGRFNLSKGVSRSYVQGLCQGDDIVIADERVALSYRSLMEGLGDLSSVSIKNLLGAPSTNSKPVVLWVPNQTMNRYCTKCKKPGHLKESCFKGVPDSELPDRFLELRNKSGKSTSSKNAQAHCVENISAADSNVNYVPEATSNKA